MSLAFDTHQYIKKLEKVGVPEEQAEVTVKMFSDVLEGRERTYRHNLASKQDLKDEVASLQLHLEEKIHESQMSQEEKIHGLEIKIHESQMSQEEKIHESRVSQEEKIHGLEFKIHDGNVSMIKWFTGVMIAQAASIVALIKLL